MFGQHSIPIKFMGVRHKSQCYKSLPELLFVWFHFFAYFQEFFVHFRSKLVMSSWFKSFWSLFRLSHFFGCCNIRSAAQLHHNSLRLLLFESVLMNMKSFSQVILYTKYAPLNESLKKSRKKILSSIKVKRDGAQFSWKEESYEALHSTEV